jgi:hypothetical protein
MPTRRTFLQVIGAAATSLALPSLAEASQRTLIAATSDHTTTLRIPLDGRDDLDKLRKVVSQAWHDAYMAITCGESRTVAHYRGYGVVILFRTPDPSHRAEVHFDHPRLGSFNITELDGGLGRSQPFWEDPCRMLCDLAEAFPTVEAFTIHTRWIETDLKVIQAALDEALSITRVPSVTA